MSSSLNKKLKIGPFTLTPSNCWMAKFIAKTASYTIKPTDWGYWFTNAGAAGAVTFTLPAPQEGLAFTFIKMVPAQNLVVTRSGTAAIRTLSGTGTTVTNATATEYGTITLVSDGTNWFVQAREGTWALS